MKLKSLIYCSVTLAGCLAACDDDISQIGNSVADDSILIFADSLTLEVPSYSVDASTFDARSENHLLGRLSSDEFGDLSCSFVSQLMAATSMDIPDSIKAERIDSVKMIFSMPRGQFIGDSLAPQQLSIYQLQKQLPSDIESNFNPEGYYSQSSLLGKKTYSLSQLSVTDTVTANRKAIRVGIDIPKSFGEKVFTAYRENPEIFSWPATFNQFFPGIYVTRSFGSGCVANVSKVEFMLYYYYLYDKAFVTDGKTELKQVHMRDSVALFATAPEVLSSNNVTFTPSEALKSRVAKGETILASPGGYNARITFPAQTIIDKFSDPQNDIYVISGLKFTIPASQISNNLGINPPPYLLMIKTSELDNYFSENKMPDNVTSFYAPYSSTDGCYEFSKMRDYIIPLLEKGKAEKEDMEFTIIPATVETQSYTINNVTTTVVTRCAPYQQKPAMVRLNTSQARIVFTYSLQQLK